MNNNHSLTHKRFDHADHAVGKEKRLAGNKQLFTYPALNLKVLHLGAAPPEASDLATATEPLPEGSGCTCHREGRLGFGFSPTLSWEVTMEG